MKNQTKYAAKRIAAILSAGALALTPVAFFVPGNTITAEAVSNTDTGTISVSGVEDGATVTAYQIVKAKYNTANDAFESWEVVTTGSGDTATGIADTSTYYLTAEEIQKYVAAVKDSNTSGSYQKYTLSKGTGTTDNGITTYTYSSDSNGVPAGMYLVLVTGTSGKYIYNPMIVSTYYSNDKLTSGTVGADSNLVNSAGATINAKRSEVSIEKKIMNPDGNSGNTSSDNKLADADDLQIGDTGEFRITTQIPEYSSSYKNLVFTITDNQDEAFDKPFDIKVYVNDIQGSTKTTPVEAKASDSSVNYTLTTNSTRVADDTNNIKALDANDFEVAFDSTYIKNNTGKYVTITYKAKLTDQAKVSAFSPNEDDVRLRYTNDISNKVGYKDDKVYEYSFPLTVKKVGEDNKTKGLQGAKYTLKRVTTGKTSNVYASEADSTWTLTTDENGICTFKNLDEGTYELTESAPPTGYAISPAVYTINITPTYSTSEATGDKMVSSYEITFTNKTTGNVEKTLTFASATDENNTSTNFVTVVDPKNPVLPSTGARSALILTIAGLGVMITVMVVAKRKKNAD